MLQDMKGLSIIAMVLLIVTLLIGSFTPLFFASDGGEITPTPTPTENLTCTPTPEEELPSPTQIITTIQNPIPTLSTSSGQTIFTLHPLQQLRHYYTNHVKRDHAETAVQNQAASSGEQSGSVIQQSSQASNQSTSQVKCLEQPPWGQQEALLEHS